MSVRSGCSFVRVVLLIIEGALCYVFSPSPTS